MNLHTKIFPKKQTQKLSGPEMMFPRKLLILHIVSMKSANVSFAKNMASPVRLSRLGSIESVKLTVIRLSLLFLKVRRGFNFSIYWCMPFILHSPKLMNS